jgi:ATP-dependent helicase YprA (DUF1998 family)
MHACSSLDGIKYALLTGDTQVKKATRRKRNIFARTHFKGANQRYTATNFLFTNPTMLEYMLRNADVPILEKSKSKLSKMDIIR